MELSSLIYLLPPFIAILLVIITRKPILSLTVSIGSGLLILYGFSFSLLKNTYTILKEVGTDSWNIKLILVLIVLGGFIGVVEYALQNKNIKLTKFFQSKKKVLFIGWLSGLLLFIDDYLNILLNGVFLNPPPPFFKYFCLCSDSFLNLDSIYRKYHKKSQFRK